jgi:hypothetical protein
MREMVLALEPLPNRHAAPTLATVVTALPHRAGLKIISKVPTFAPCVAPSGQVTAR